MVNFESKEKTIEKIDLCFEGVWKHCGLIYENVMLMSEKFSIKLKI